MKYFKTFVVLALVLSVGINISMISRISEVENKINSLNNYQSQIMRSVDGQTSHIQNILNDMKQEQSWMSSISMDMDKGNIENGEAKVKFEWQIKELQTGSEVMFHYKFADEDDFTSILATEQQNGLFSVLLPIELNLEPVWHVMVSDRNGNQEEKSKQVLEEQMRQQGLEYYVSVSSDGLMKSGSMHTSSLGNFSASQYGIIEAELNMHKDSFTIFLNNNVLDKGNGNSITDVDLVITNQDNAVEELKLNAEQGGRAYFQTFDRGENEYKKLTLKVTYRNGSTFEKDIYIGK
ncbi:hypothetical protein EJF36_02760 [Bacillus sp. HMF5848]|uniref:hypothetical protein n=1 Tax=Bacillus sp. HMF5848 TaxID=2495421 RepID=UPI000F7909A0|nr:hypothetical protein [Bacillus sp. HMF5848]RSK25898.1 hypothetical protein EJF36_02760 [Bacillus sp. HMF5848]